MYVCLHAHVLHEVEIQSSPANWILNLEHPMRNGSNGRNEGTPVINLQAYSIFIHCKVVCFQKWTCIHIVPYWSLKALCTTFVTFTHSNTHSYTEGRVCHARCQLHIRSDTALSILSPDTDRELGIEPQSQRNISMLLCQSRASHIVSDSQFLLKPKTVTQF